MARYNKNRYGSIVLNDRSGGNFTITKKEQKEIKTLVKRANEKRKYYMEKFYNDVKNHNNMKGISKDAYSNLLNKKGFITEKYSTSFNQFKSKKEVQHFIKELKSVTKKGYYNNHKKVNDIRKSMIKQINNMFGNDGKEVKKLIRNISDSDLMSIYINNDTLIQEIYYSDNTVEEFVEKTKSDINIALKKLKG